MAVNVPAIPIAPTVAQLGIEIFTTLSVDEDDISFFMACRAKKQDKMANASRENLAA
jgi:hypothetical protein